MESTIQIIGIEGLPEIRPGDDVAEQVLRAAAQAGLTFQQGDVLVIAQKIISKAEGRLVSLNDIEPSEFARAIATTMNKDARIVEIVLRESKRIVRMDRNVMIVETHHGFVCANAGVDQSNVAGGWVSLLPRDPDGSAARIRQQLAQAVGIDLAVIISDTFGRPWRQGLVEVAIGVAGLHPLMDYRGLQDSYGYILQASVVAIADELAAAAGLVFGKTNGIPAAVIRGYRFTPALGSAKTLLRPADRDLFR
ncbi:MAG: coenzyme F420-0:L-glutamate ligase [Acidobacteriota bacterium]|nr:coenzyme F420-0:L-glutamate ligase [Blastocatellia bacterium]MDW8239274.1 coenzyme F420-0:L-glutamate ligase [Acidobacteriota bacterium]